VLRCLELVHRTAGARHLSRNQNVGMCQSMMPGV
jgi:hypothetical protein